MYEERQNKRKTNKQRTVNKKKIRGMKLLQIRREKESAEKNKIGVKRWAVRLISTQMCIKDVFDV